jgi:GNAT superfamily N-acetyltransferase
MVQVPCRPATTDDLPSLVETYSESCGDMLARHGLGTIVMPPAVVGAIYTHLLKTGVCFVAEDEGKVVGLAVAIIRGTTWFLSGFWVRPAWQRRGVGGPLLRESFTNGQQAGASVLFVWSSVDATAMASYLKLGMLPGYPLLPFSGVPRPPEAPAGYEIVPLDADAVAAIDRTVRGAERPLDHAFWADQAGAEAFCVARRGQIVGYFCRRPGVIGPVAGREPEDAVAALALAQGRTPAAEVRVTIPGPHHAAIRLALSCGLRFGGAPHLLTTRPFGRPDCYVPSGPALY